jgi:cell division topological specificity factor
MSSFFDRLQFGKGKSANQAKERLKFVLIHDRAEMTPKELNDLKNEILEVISRHIDIDPSAVVIQMAQEGREQRLIADIPLKQNKRHQIG